MKNKISTLEPDTFYHIYNRANGSEDIFVTNQNYLFFLSKYIQYITPICNTYCYCLMSNHFHFLIEIKGEKELKRYFHEKPNITDLLSKQFSNFFNSYSKAFNKQQERKGSLFIRPFKRKKITNKAYLYKLVQYIHNNPIEGGLCKNASEWKYSSYNAICSNTNTLVKKKDVIEWFDSIENFKYVHQQKLKELDLSFD